MKRILYLLVTIMLVLALTGCGAVLTSAAKLTKYDMGDDAIPSINSLVGERKVKSVQSSTSDGVSVKQYQYASDAVYDDLLAYVKKLMEDGWLVTQDIDLNVVPGSGELGAKSVEEGQIIMLSFTYDDAGYTIKITKGKGTLE